MKKVICVKSIYKGKIRQRSENGAIRKKEVGKNKMDNKVLILREHVNYFEILFALFLLFDHQIRNLGLRYKKKFSLTIF